jgi:predicted DsbA family dithiol-disulfide isomerase
MLVSADCPPITQSQERALLRYVRAKYKLSADLPVRLVREGVIANTCNERIRFASADPGRYFNYSVILLPDHVFFTREVVDSSVDPLAEERKAARLLQERLLAGRPPSKGPATAPVTIVVFSDFQCPYCAQAAQTIEKAVPAAGVAVRLVYRYFPLAIHPWAVPAAKAAACANAQSSEAFWKLHDYYFQHQRELTKENVTQKSTEFVHTLPGLNLAAYTACLESASTEALINKDIELGKAVQVRGTPTIFVNGQRVGAADLMQAVREAAGEMNRR